MDGVGAWAAVAAIVAAAGVAQGLSGFGFSLISIPLLSLVVPVKAAIVGGAFLGLVQSGLVVARDHRHIDRRSAAVLVLAALAGMPIGLFVITRVSEEPLQVVIAVTVLVFTGLLWRRVRLPTDSLPAEVGVGFTSGMLSTSTGMSGPPLVIALQARGVPPSAFRATLATVFVSGSAISLLLFWSRGTRDDRRGEGGGGRPAGSADRDPRRRTGVPAGRPRAVPLDRAGAARRERGARAGRRADLSALSARG